MFKQTSTSSLSAFVGNTITGSTAGVKAKVLAAVAATGGDPDTLYIKYNTSGTANATQLFVTSYVLGIIVMRINTYSTIDGHLKSSDSWDYFVVRLGFILIRYQLAVNITMSPNFRHHVENNFTVRI